MGDLERLIELRKPNDSSCTPVQITAIADLISRY